MIFLSSLPRSGSTLLTSLLNQRPDVYASPTSNLCDTVGAAVQAWEQNPTTQAQGGTQEDLMRIVEGIMANRYDTDKLVFDKGRQWAAPQIIQTMSMIQDVKIVATVRPIAECLASFAKIMKVPKKEMKAFCEHSHLAKHLFQSYATLKAGYEAFPDKFLLVEYDDIINAPQAEMDRISDFLDMDEFDHNFDGVEDSKEQDKAWGIKDLHKVRPKVAKQNYNAKRLLTASVWNHYQGGEFWNDKPDPKIKKSPIQKQHDALMKGDFELSKKLAYDNIIKFPSNDDMAFNAGWAKLSDGEVQEGYKLLDRGRNTTVWGDPHFGSTTPVWQGEEGATVLLRLERGLGDQLHQVRYARNLKAAGCTVIVSCQSQLAEVIRYADGVDAVVQHEAACGVLHDFHLPAMSAPIQLGLTQETIDGTSYIKLPEQVEKVSGRVGLRWSGNPLYEHSTKRLFPHELMFNSVKGRNCISLQRDEGSELRPRWVDAVGLDSWTDTAKAVASCELVITSCTSVAHLAGAMGVPTWILVPKVPYYLWTYHGIKTPYYNSVTLFRQTEVDNWDEPFAAMDLTKGKAYAA